MQITRILLIAGLVLFIIFLLQNITIVPINFLFWSIEMPRAILLLLAFLLGYLAAATARMNQRKSTPD